MVPILKTSSISPKEKYGGGGRYNAILEFKGVQIKKIDEKEKNEKEKERKRNKEEKVYV
jgi:hypothetical protein